MARRKATPRSRKYTTSLIFVEGDTEEEFYELLFKKHLTGISKKTFNLEGNYGGESKVLHRTMDYLWRHPGATVKIFIFIDRESRKGYPPIDLNVIRETLYKNNKTRKRILNIEEIVATQMIESWFFYDIQGIFNFLRVPSHERNARKYTPIEKLTHIDLSKLFSKYGKVYIKGKRCRNFLQHLDIDKIYKSCPELRRGITSIISSRKRKRQNKLNKKKPPRK